MTSRAEGPGAGADATGLGNRARPATVVDVATRAGVSAQTVSRAMNDQYGISPRTRDRVLAAAAELRYRPSRHGRQMQSPGLPALGVVMEDLTNPFAGELAAAVSRAAADRGWHAVVADRLRWPEAQERLADLVRQVDGLIGYLDDRSPLLTPHLPAVLLELGEPAGPTGGLAIDFGPGAELLARHWGAVGVRHTALVDIPGTGVSPRLRTVQQVLSGHGMGTEVIAVAGESPAAIGPALDTLLDAHPEIEAVWAFNDLAAISVLRLLQRRGVDVPGRIRVAGADGIALGRYLPQTLTTLALDLPALARTLVDLLVDMFEGRAPLHGPGAHRRVEHTLRVGDTG